MQQKGELDFVLISIIVIYVNLHNHVLCEFVKSRGIFEGKKMDNIRPGGFFFSKFKFTCEVFRFFFYLISLV